VAALGAQQNRAQALLRVVIEAGLGGLGALDQTVDEPVVAELNGLLGERMIHRHLERSAGERAAVEGAGERGIASTEAQRLLHLRRAMRALGWRLGML